jgi:hypothetical protein
VAALLCGQLRVQISVRTVQQELKFLVGVRSIVMQIFEHYIDLGNNIDLEHNIDLGNNLNLGHNIDLGKTST